MLHIPGNNFYCLYLKYNTASQKAGWKKVSHNGTENCIM